MFLSLCLSQPLFCARALSSCVRLQITLSLSLTLASSLTFGLPCVCGPDMFFHSFPSLLFLLYLHPIPSFLALFTLSNPAPPFVPSVLFLSLLSLPSLLCVYVCVHVFSIISCLLCVCVCVRVRHA